MGAAEYTKKLAADIMSGKGPDLISLDVGTFKYSNVYKMMSTGVFADLNEFFDNDSDLNIEDFNKTVFNAGVFKDKRYIVPLEYSIPIMLSTEYLINKTGINTTNCKDYFEFTSEIEKYLEANKNNTNAFSIFGLPKMINNYYQYMGVNILDYENKKVNIDTSEFKRATEFYKLLYPQELIKNKEKGLGYYKSTDLEENKMIFKSYKRGNCLDYFFSDSMRVAQVDKPVAMPIKDINGGVQAQISDSVAIRRNSANKQNAYNFIKLMLSPEMMKGRQFMNIPIGNTIARNLCSNYTKTGYFNFSDGIERKAITNEYCDEYMKIAGSVTGTYFPTPFENKFFELMEPFYKGDKSYEECIKNAKDQMEIYITE